ncbi:MAG: hypothetical protein WBO19_19895, partial [Terriglobia bacterium]
DNTVALSSTRAIRIVADVRTLHAVVDPDVAPPELTLWRDGRGGKVFMENWGRLSPVSSWRLGELQQKIGSAVYFFCARRL